MQAAGYQGAEEEARGLRVRPRRAPGPRGTDRCHRTGTQVSTPHQCQREVETTWIVIDYFIS